jgi:hypothetical protein
MLVEGADALRRQFERIHHRTAKTFYGCVDLGIGNPEIPHLYSVEYARVLAHGSIASTTYVAEDAPHDFLGAKILAERAGNARPNGRGQRTGIDREPPAIGQERRSPIRRRAEAPNAPRGDHGRRV